MTLISTRRVHSGRVVSLDIDTVEFPNGNVGELEMLRHPGAAAVVPFLDDATEVDPRILLIRQFRHATSGWLWEIPAGRREPGEDPLATAHRELREETGCTAERIEPITWIWTTPGFTDEVIHLYSAHGLVRGDFARENDEVMELHEVRLSEVRKMIGQGEITDAKTCVAVLGIIEKLATGDSRRQ
ncbi:MAG TPA: NUDIX hydrolase [Gemmatimonadales bacterium]|nr:NUDIX hydrolase [Gemmatimonadales bacterium]